MQTAILIQNETSLLKQFMKWSTITQEKWQMQDKGEVSAENIHITTPHQQQKGDNYNLKEANDGMWS